MYEIGTNEPSVVCGFHMKRGKAGDLVFPKQVISHMGSIRTM